MPRNSDDIASFKQSIDYLSGKIDELSTIKQNASQILSLVNKFQSIIIEKDKQVGVLKANIDDLEQYQKRKTLSSQAKKTSQTSRKRHLFPEKGSRGTTLQNKNWNHYEMLYLNYKLMITMKAGDRRHK